MTTNGDILTYIKTKKTDKIRLVRPWLLILWIEITDLTQLENVARGLEHIHRSGIIHGDLNGVR